MPSTSGKHAMVLANAARVHGTSRVQSSSGSTDPYAATLAANFPAYYSAFAAALAQQQEATTAAASATFAPSPAAAHNTQPLASLPPPQQQQQQHNVASVAQPRQEAAFNFGPIGSRIGAPATVPRAVAGGDELGSDLSALRLTRGDEASALSFLQVAHP